jgi:hypothetical protein
MFHDCWCVGSPLVERKKVAKDQAFILIEQQLAGDCLEKTEERIPKAPVLAVGLLDNVV